MSTQLNSPTGKLFALGLLGFESVEDVNCSAVKPCDTQTILSQHTAVRPSRWLGASYTTQSIASGLPFLVFDLLVTAACFLLSANLVDWFIERPFYWGTINQMFALLLLQVLLLALHDVYPGVGDSQISLLRGLVRSTLFSYVCLASVNAMLGKLPQFEFFAFLIGAVSTSVLLPICRGFATRILSKRLFWGFRAIVVGDPKAIESTIARLQENPSCGYRAVASCSESTAENEHGMFLNTDIIGETARRHNAPVVILAAGDGRPKLSERLIFEFPSVVVFSNSQMATADGERSPLPGALVTRINRPLPRLMPRIVKRVFDLMLSIPMVIVLLPAFAAVAIAIKVYSPGPVFYGDPRIGQHGRRFKMWKFRTMIPNATELLAERLCHDQSLRSEWNDNHKLRNDPRVIPVIGYAMRRWSIDEFPQLWNVITGEMSLVGPRPVPPGEVVKYSEKFFEYTHMMPGLTGLWQVAGRSETSFQVRVNLVEYYAKNWSIWLDLWILARTPAVVLKSEGAY